MSGLEPIYDCPLMAVLRLTFRVTEMKLRSRTIRIIVVLSMLTISVYCRAATVRLPESLTGSYIWAIANHIYKWDASRNEKELVVALPDGMEIGALTEINSEQLLFSAVNLAVAGAPGALKDYLWLFDLSTGILKRLRRGSAPTYVANSHKLFFYAYSRRDKGVDLYAADFNGAIVNAKVVHKGSFFSPSPVIQVSRKSVILDYDVETAPHQVLDYDIHTGKWHKLPIRGCSPVLWRSASKQLLCTKGDSFHYYLTGLRGDRKKKVGVWRGVIFSAYIPRLDAAIAMRPRAFSIAERNDAWGYYFKTGKWRKIILGVTAAQGSAIWVSGG